MAEGWKNEGRLVRIRQAEDEEQKEAEHRRSMLEDKKTGVERGKLSN